MADALDSKSSYRKIVWVQVPPPVFLLLDGLINNNGPIKKGAGGTNIHSQARTCGNT